jgi:hypothetical protein
VLLRENYTFGVAYGAFIMSKKEVIFGVKYLGVTWLFYFCNRKMFNAARAGARRLGVSLGELISQKYLFTGFQKLPEAPRKFTEEDRKASTLKIQIVQCDEFTRKCLKRQTDFCGFRTIEEYILDQAFPMLINDEDCAILHGQTEEVVMTEYDLGIFDGCEVDRDAAKPPPDSFTRVHIPRGTIVESLEENDIGGLRDHLAPPPG